MEGGEWGKGVGGEGGRWRREWAQEGSCNEPNKKELHMHELCHAARQPHLHRSQTISRPRSSANAPSCIKRRVINRIFDFLGTIKFKLDQQRKI